MSTTPPSPSPSPSPSPAAPRSAPPPLSQMQLYVGCEWGYALRDLMIARVESGLGHTTPPRGAAIVCNHIFISDGTTVIEAVWPRVHRTPLAHKDASRYRLYKVPCRPEQASSIWLRANERVGEWYDAAGLAVALWYVITHQESKWWGNDHASVFCSELVCDLLMPIYPSLRKPPPWDQDPAMLELRLAAMFPQVM